MNAQRTAFTLLEIVLALALLAGALAALGEVLRLARQNAEYAAYESQAQLLASSVMAELMTGVREPVEVQQAFFPMEVDPPWQFSIAISPTEFNELLLVEIRVEQQLPATRKPANFTLRRWVLSPDYVTQLESAAQTAAQGVGSATTGF